MRVGICAFCRKEREVTKEHFVPRGLWAGPRPNRVITAPTCMECNNGASDDDQYFRNVMAVSYGPEHPEARAVFEGPMKRSIGYDRTVAKDLLKKPEVRPYFSPDGIWLGNRPSSLVDEGRLNRVLCKVVLGLFYDARDYALPETHDVYLGIYPEGDFYRTLLDMTKDMCPEQSFGDDVFIWRFAGDAEDPNLTFWMLGFYRQVVYFAATLQEEDAEQLKGNAAMTIEGA